jgi:hypothetical protein
MKTSRWSFLILSIAICFPFPIASAGEPNPDAFVNQEAKGNRGGNDSSTPMPSRDCPPAPDHEGGAHDEVLIE